MDYSWTSTNRCFRAFAAQLFSFNFSSPQPSAVFYTLPSPSTPPRTSQRYSLFIEQHLRRLDSLWRGKNSAGEKRGSIFAAVHGTRGLEDKCPWYLPYCLSRGARAGPACIIKVKYFLMKLKLLRQKHQRSFPNEVHVMRKIAKVSATEGV